LPHSEYISKNPNFLLQEIDPLLPKVSEALVLVTQCIISLALDACENVEGRVGELGEDESGWIDEDEKSDEVTGMEVRRIISEAMGKDGKGFVERLIGPSSGIFVMFIRNNGLPDLLQIMDVFMPRIRVEINSSDNSNHAKQVPAQSPKNKPENDDVTEPMAGFSYLKRDLVRLLGILCYTNKAVQDRVRICGGIKTILNLCVIDERSPCELF
jgi:ataxin-10